MDTKQVNDTLRERFFEQEQRLIFWYDAKAEFTDVVSKLAIDEVIIWRLDVRGQLETKIELERTNPEQKYLLYAPHPKPENADNWLLDLLLYSDEFSADRASVLLNELGLSGNPALTEHLALRGDFFKSKARSTRFKELVEVQDDENLLDLKILTVLTRASYASVEEILLTLLNSFEGEGSFFSRDNKRWDDVVKFGMEASFWQWIENEFSYDDEHKSLQLLLTRLMICHLNHQLPKQKLPLELHRYLFKQTKGRNNASVFISHWMQNEKLNDEYEYVSEEIERELDLISPLSQIAGVDLAKADGFIGLDKIIIRELISELLDNPGFDRDRIEKIISERRNKFWLERKQGAVKNIYAALASAAELFDLQRIHGSGFNYDSPAEMFSAYCEDLYRFDKAYRHYHAALRKSSLGDILKGDLKDRVENIYGHWYMSQLCREWDRFVENKLSKDWSLGTSLPKQQDFFSRQVRTKLSTDGKIFVIISDAMRFEVGHELNDRINREGSLRESKLSGMLGVLPSYTQLGMAALLPHQELKINEKGVVEIDGKNVTSSNRGEFLKARVDESATIQAEDLMVMTRTEGREFIKDKKLIYVYHNQIDNIGDKAGTELRTFEAAESAIDEINKMINFITNTLQVGRVMVTADHGFLYSVDPMDEDDRSAYQSGGTESITKKRYIIGQDLAEQAHAFKIPLNQVLGSESKTETVVPKADGRFHFKGGARFVHGGAALQEICVPLIEVTILRGKKAAASARVEKVEVELLDKQRKITTLTKSVNFLQTQAVQGKKQPVTLKLGFYTAKDEAISDEQIVCFDSAHESPGERQQKVIFTIKSGDYDKNQDYYLMMVDTESGKVCGRHAYKVSLGFSADEFGF